MKRHQEFTPGAVFLEKPCCFIDMLQLSDVSA